jgi:hypothetical protein
LSAQKNKGLFDLTDSAFYDGRDGFAVSADEERQFLLYGNLQQNMPVWINIFIPDRCTIAARA